MGLHRGIHTCGTASRLVAKHTYDKYFTGGNMQDLCFQTFSPQPLFLPFVVFHSKSKLKYMSMWVCGLETCGWGGSGLWTADSWMDGWMDVQVAHLKVCEWGVTAGSCAASPQNQRYGGAWYESKCKLSLLFEWAEVKTLPCLNIHPFRNRHDHQHFCTCDVSTTANTPSHHSFLK